MKNINSVFNNTQNSYKFYWWLSIIDLCFQEGKKELSYDEIFFKIISKLWYPVNYFKLSFGKIDQCSKYIKQIKDSYQLDDNLSEKDLYNFLNENKKSELLSKITKELKRYVPYRFIRPWYEYKLRGLKDSLVNSKILTLQNELAPYIIDATSNKIVINNEWFIWINENYKLAKSFTHYELIRYLEKENPNVTNLSKKLEKPESRNLDQPIKYWKSFIKKSPYQTDIFENKPLVHIDKMSIDHFLPWSLIAHDQLWNLHPISKNVNSSKNNFIPQKKYLMPFSFLQYNFCKYLLEEKANRALEGYNLLFNCSNEELKSATTEKFLRKINDYYLPQFEVAKNMGFGQDWVYLS